MRDLLTGLAALLALALLALMVGPHFVDWDSQRGRVAGLISQRAGIPVRIDGPLSVRILPTPTLDAELVTVGPEEAPIARVERLHLGLSAVAMLSGRMAFSEARAEAPVLVLAGLRPWLERLDPRRATSVPAIGFEALYLERLSVVESLGTSALAGPFTLTIEAPSLIGPYRIQGQDGSLQRDLKLQIGQFDKGRARLRGTVDDRGFGGRLTLDGWFAVPGLPGRPLFDGAATFSGNPVLGAPPVQVPFQGSARLVLHPDQMLADPVNLTLGTGDHAVALAGQAFLDLAEERPRLKGRLEAKRFDATSFLQPGAEGRAAPRLDLGILPATSPVDGQLDLALGALQLPGGLVQGLTARLGFEAAGIRLEAASAALPGGTKLEFQRPETAGSVPLAGHLRVETDELHVLAGWLRGGDGIAQLPQKARLALDLAGDFAGIALNGIRLDSPAGQLRGVGRFTPASGLAGALPRLALDLAAERFDGRVLAALEPLRPVPGLDLSSRLAISRLVVDGRDMGGLDVELERAQENGTLRHLRLSGPRGESVVLSGTTSGEGLNLTAKLDAARLGELSRVAAALLPGPLTEMIIARAGVLEPALAVANLRLQTGNGEVTWDIAFDGKFAGTDISGRSQSVVKGDQLQVSLTGRLANADGTRLASQLAGVPLPPGEGAGLVEIRAEGNPRRLVSGQVTARLGQSEFRMEGGLNPFRSTPLEGRISLETTDAGRIGKALAGNLPTLGDGQAARASAMLRASRETVSLSQIEASLGDGKLSGDMGFDLTRGGQVAGRLKLGALALEGLLSPVLGRNWPDFRASWPRTGFGTAIRPPLSGDLWIEAEGLALPDGMVLQGPQFVLRFAPDSVALEGFEAKAGEARVAGTLTLLRKGERAEAAGRLELARWPIRAPGGRVSGTLPFAASGASWLELVASLSGAGQLAFDDLVVPGFDPGALPRVAGMPIDSIDPVTELNVGALVDKALQQGEWRMPGRSQPASAINGQIRVSPVATQVMIGETNVSILPSIQFDLVRREVEARFQLRQDRLPAGWKGAAPEISLALQSRHDARQGEMTPLQRRLDVASLLNGFLALAIQRDLEKAEAFEADLRERSFHLRRQRADAFMARRQQEIADVEAAIARDMVVIRSRAAAQAELERQQALAAELARQAEEERRRREAEGRSDATALPPGRGAPLDLTPRPVPPPG